MALIDFDGGKYQELEDTKTLKAVMFLMIQEHVKKLPNDEKLGAEVRKLINKFNENN